jgi:hypothetical protein
MKKLISLCLLSILCGAAFAQAPVTNGSTGLHVALATSGSPGAATADGITLFVNSGVITDQNFPSDFAVPITSGVAAFSANVSNKVNYLLLTSAVTSSTLTAGGTGHAGFIFHWVICQDGTGGRGFTAPTAVISGTAPMVAAISGAPANTCAEQTFIWSTSLGAFIPYSSGIEGNASALVAGTIPDARQSSNVCLLTTANCVYKTSIFASAQTYAANSCNLVPAGSTPVWWQASSTVTLTVTSVPTTANGLLVGLQFFPFNPGGAGPPQVYVCNISAASITTTVAASFILTGTP